MAALPPPPSIGSSGARKFSFDVESDQAGSAEAFFAQGQRFEKTDIDLAITNYEKAAKLKHAPSYAALGRIYYFVKRDYHRALHWLNDKILKEDQQSLFYAGTIYQNQMHDFHRAQACYLEATQFGHGDAKYALGTLFEKGYKERGVVIFPPDWRQAAYWYNKACLENHHIEAFYALGILYRKGGPNLRKDTKEAIRLLNIAAMANHQGAQRALGRMLFIGEGGRRDVERAHSLMKRGVFQMENLYDSEERRPLKLSESQRSQSGTERKVFLNFLRLSIHSPKSNAVKVPMEDEGEEEVEEASEAPTKKRKEEGKEDGESSISTWEPGAPFLKSPRSKHFSDQS